MTTAFENARVFIYRNARPLDYARFRFHFEGGDQAAVLSALAVYQNPDGGFGHGLEADAWNPASTPIQTWAATEILREIQFTDRNHPVLAGILRYLAGGRDFDGKTWANIVPSNNDHPHAPWWHYTIESSPHETYNPTACLAGFSLRFAADKSDLHGLGRRLAQEAVARYFAGDLLEDMHTVGCYLRLLEYLEEAKEESVADLAALRERLRSQVRYSLTAETDQWETGYICRPSHFFNRRDSVFYADNQALAEYEGDFILRSQQPDGAWPIPWGWGDYPEEWARQELVAVQRDYLKLTLPAGDGEIMNLGPTTLDPDLLPAELGPFLRGAKAYDRSCSPAAKVYYIQKDKGYFLKSAAVGALGKEAAMTRYFHSKGLAPQVVAYISAAADWLLTERLAGEDCRHERYLAQPQRLADTLAAALALLHATDPGDCLQNHTRGYLERALQNYETGNYDPSHFPDSFGYANAEEALKVIKEGGHNLKADTLIHGDYCLPNILLQDWRLAGFVDLDNAGVGDRHVDIFWGLWSLWFNLHTDKYRQRFIDAYGRDLVDEERLRVVAAVEVFG